MINSGGGNNGANSSKSEESGGLTKANKITIGLAVPGAIAGAIGILLYIRKWRNRNKNKAGGEGVGGRIPGVAKPEEQALQPKAPYKASWHGNSSGGRWGQRDI